MPHRESVAEEKITISDIRHRRKEKPLTGSARSCLQLEHCYFLVSIFLLRVQHTFRCFAGSKSVSYRHYFFCWAINQQTLTFSERLFMRISYEVLRTILVYCRPAFNPAIPSLLFLHRTCPVNGNGYCHALVCNCLFLLGLDCCSHVLPFFSLVCERFLVFHAALF